MELSALTVRVLLLFFPGVLCALLVDALTVHKERKAVEFLTHAFLLGIGSYLTLYVARELVDAVAELPWSPYRPLPLTFFDALLDVKARIAWGEIFLAAVSAVALAGTVSAFATHKVLHRLAKRWHISRKIGELDLWALLFNAPGTSGWVTVRDLRYDLMFFGWVEAFSDMADKPQLILRDVVTFEGSTGRELYRSDRVFLAREADSIIIEPFPSRSPDNVGAGDGLSEPHTTAARREVHQGWTEHGSADPTTELHAGPARTTHRRGGSDGEEVEQAGERDPDPTLTRPDE